MNRILITGASGLVGAALSAHLQKSGCGFAPLARSMRSDGMPEWRIEGPARALIHAAARVHVMHEVARDPLIEFRKVNVEGTLELARQAARAKVRRFVFVSSVKVNGEATTAKPFASGDVPSPMDAYGISKLEAENGLFDIARQTGMDVVVVRPPLIYGPGVRANFLKLMKLVKSGIPLPLGAIDNRRSMLAIDNLIDLLVLCTHHQAAPGQVFMASDDNDVSTATLLRMLAKAMHRRALLLPVPPAIIAGSAALLGKSAVAERLLGSLQVDVAHTRSTLDWSPRVGMEEALQNTVSHFLEHF
ncbi:MAG: SDR family oxidoreductase [Massilia sp.]